MRAIVNIERKPHRVEMQERAKPEFGPLDVLLRVRGVGVCGSDLHQWHATHSWNVNYPVILGHEFGGEIAAVGAEVVGLMEGDRVVSETAAFICERCVYCRSGLYNLCPERLGFGYGVDGAMADYVRVPARCLHKVPGNVSMEDAAMTEPGCVAANAVLELSQVKPGDFVVVIGPGPIGLMALQMAKLNGPSELWMVGTRRDSARLNVAQELGATRVLVTEEEEPARSGRRAGAPTGDRLRRHRSNRKTEHRNGAPGRAGHKSWVGQRTTGVFAGSPGCQGGADSGLVQPQLGDLGACPPALLYRPDHRRSNSARIPPRPMAGSLRDDGLPRHREEHPRSLTHVSRNTHYSSLTEVVPRVAQVDALAGFQFQLPGEPSDAIQVRPPVGPAIPAPPGGS